MKIKFTVTADHWGRARELQRLELEKPKELRRHYTKTCAVAVALSEAIGQPAEVFVNSARVAGKLARLPNDARVLVALYDTRLQEKFNGMVPLEVELDFDGHYP